MKNTMKAVKNIKSAFPDLPSDFYSILIDRIREKNFSDLRFKKAVEYVIDHCPYPKPTIANFVSYDQKIELLTYDQVIKKVMEVGAIVWDTIDKIRIDDGTFWIKKQDLKYFQD